jgi:hypothetical protein
MKIYELIKSIYLELNDNSLENNGLLSFQEGKIKTPLANDTLDLFSHRSSLKDGLIEDSIIKELIQTIMASGKYKGINHIGFCYQVDSKQKEVFRILQLIKDSEFHTYEEPSNDETEWIFVGEDNQRDSPLIELALHEGKSQDGEVDYWLPHIQIDIDTDFSPEEVTKIIRQFIHSPKTTLSFKINGIVYFKRVRIGCLEGINIFLDIATNNRNPYYRKNWTELI